MLDDEGKRCWTIEYATEVNRPGFHIDILPALKSNEGTLHNIDITKLKLLTNSPAQKKRVGITGYGLEVVERINY